MIPDNRNRLLLNVLLTATRTYKQENKQINKQNIGYIRTVKVNKI